MDKDKMVLQNTNVGKYNHQFDVLLRLLKVQRIVLIEKSMKN